MTEPPEQFVVWKYEVPISNNVYHIEMPEGAAPLAVGFQQYGKATVWVLVDPNAPKKIRSFFTIGTGTQFPVAAVRAYIGTVQHKPTKEVFHLFEYEEDEAIDELLEELN